MSDTFQAGKPVTIADWNKLITAVNDSATKCSSTKLDTLSPPKVVTRTNLQKIIDALTGMCGFTAPPLDSPLVISASLLNSLYDAARNCPCVTCCKASYIWTMTTHTYGEDGIEYGTTVSYFSGETTQSSGEDALAIEKREYQSLQDTYNAGNSNWSNGKPLIRHTYSHVVDCLQIPPCGDFTVMVCYCAGSWHGGAPTCDKCIDGVFLLAVPFGMSRTMTLANAQEDCDILNARASDLAGFAVQPYRVMPGETLNGTPCTCIGGGMG